MSFPGLSRPVWICQTGVVCLLAAFPWVGWGAVLGAAVLVVAGASAALESRRAARREADGLDANRQLEAVLAHRRSSFEALASGLDVALFVCDRDGNVAFANRRATEVFDFAQPVGRSLLAVAMNHDLERLVADVAERGEPAEAEVLLTTPTERVGIAHAWSSAPDGQVFLTIYDVTDLRRLERVRRDFVANVSHELRTPLTLIRAMAETLLDGNDLEEVPRRYLGKIVLEVDRLTTISQDLLVLSAAESNPVQTQPSDLAEVFRSVAAELAPTAAAKGLSLAFEGPESLIAPAHPAQIRQVAVNLIQNAINYTNAGSVVVRMRQEADKVVAEVEDTGVGMASEHLPRIFERFYRVDKARSRSTGGTGLGLSIVKHIVEAHGGTISVESVLNQGSTFTVSLPSADAPTPPHATEPVRTGSPSDPPTPPRTP